MEFHNDHLQEIRKYAAPEKLIDLDYLSLTPTVIERDIENALLRERTSLK